VFESINSRACSHQVVQEFVITEELTALLIQHMPLLLLATPSQVARLALRSHWLLLLWLFRIDVVWWLNCSFAQSEHISKAKLTHSVSIGDLTLRLAQLTSCVELYSKLIWIHCTVSDTAGGAAYSVRDVLLLEVVQGSFSEHEFSLVWVVLHWSTKHNHALLHRVDVGTLHQTPLVLILVQ
jgi:hypothetical protein